MDKFIVISIIFLISIVVVEVNSSPPGWSSWQNCTGPQNCIQRIFICDAGEGIECLNETNGAFEQRAFSCSENSKCLENVAEMFPASTVSA